MAGKLHIIGLGGCGINIASKILPDLESLGRGFAEVDFRFVDTSESTIKEYADRDGYLDNFHKVTSASTLNKELDGTGGERKSNDNVKAMNASIRSFVDKGLPNTKEDYYVLIASGGGGTGSTLENLMLGVMLEQDYTVITVTVGDNSSFMTLNNTISTLVSLQNIALRNKACISNIYYNNTISGETSPKTMNNVDNKIFKMLSIISMFISGSVQNIDNQDMINFFRPDKYTTIDIDAGIYNLGVAIERCSDENALLVRTLISSDTEDIPMSIVPRQHKAGTITEGGDKFQSIPLFLLVRKDVLNIEVGILREEHAKLEELKKSRYDSFDSFGDEADEFGLTL